MSYKIIVNEDSIYSSIKEINKRRFNFKKVEISLFSLNELIKIYPNFKLIKDYIYFGKDILLNYKNYKLFEDNLNYGDYGKIKYTCEIYDKDFIPNLDGTYFCKFAKYDFKDIYIKSGVYIYNWMIKSIDIYSDNTRLASARIAHLYNSSIVENVKYIDCDFQNPSVVETTEGFILKF